MEIPLKSLKLALFENVKLYDISGFASSPDNKPGTVWGIHSSGQHHIQHFCFLISGLLHTFVSNA